MLARSVGVFVVGAAVLSGIRPAGAGGDKTAPPPASAAAAAAAMAGLDARFAETCDDPVIFVEAGPLVPAGLTRVGKCKAEVVTEADLRTRFEGKRVAPSLARVRVREAREKGQTVYTVGVSSSGVVVKGAEAVPIGGGRWYKYTVAAGKVTLVEQGSVQY